MSAIASHCLELDLHRLELRFASARLLEPHAVEQLARSIERCGQVGAPGSATGTHAPAARGLLNGPRLDGDSGHASQRDIDKIFDWHGVLSKPAF